LRYLKEFLYVWFGFQIVFRAERVINLSDQNHWLTKYEFFSIYPKTSFLILLTRWQFRVHLASLLIFPLKNSCLHSTYFLLDWQPTMSLRCHRILFSNLHILSKALQVKPSLLSIHFQSTLLFSLHHCTNFRILKLSTIRNSLFHLQQWALYQN